MADTNTLDLSDLSSEPVESNVKAEISDAPSDVEEPVATEAPVEAPVEVPVETEAPEEPSAPSTEEVVENVKEILSTEPVADNSTDLQERVKVLEERLEKLINVLSPTGLIKNI